MSSNWLVKLVRACLVSRCKKGTRIFYRRRHAFCRYRCVEFFYRTTRFFSKYPVGIY